MQDKDGDGLPDKYEEEQQLSSTDPEDATQDHDRDGVQNRDEFIIGTDPHDADTDKDGIEDGAEVEQGTDPQENACITYGGGSMHFADIDDHWSRPYVLHLHQTKVHNTRLVQGYTKEDRSVFLPDRPITRFELLKLALFSGCIPLQDDDSAPAQTFSDVPHAPRPVESDDRRQLRRVVYTAVANGIVDGYPDGTFRPDDSVNRAEAVKILLQAADPEPVEGSYNNGHSFRDVQTDDWFQPHVKLAAAYDLVQGYPDGTFRPGHNLTRAEASKLVMLLLITNPRVNGYVVPTDNLPDT